MRILILVHSLRRGGAERVSLELARGFIESGHFVEVVAWVDVDNYQEDRYKSIARHYLMPQSEYRWYFSIPCAARRLRAIATAFKPDAIQIHTPNLAVLAAWAALRTPTLHVLHGYEEISTSFTFKGWVAQRVARAAHRRLEPLLVVVSESMRPAAAAYFGTDCGSIRVVPNGVNLDTFNIPSTQARNRPKIIMVGTLNSNKGQGSGIEAFRLLLRQSPTAVLLIVGDGEKMSHLREQVMNSGLLASVQLLGQRADIAELLSASHVLWQLSRSEAMPMVVLEATAAGVPVVGFDVRGTCDVVRSGNTGFLVPYGDITAVVARTLSLLEDREMWIAFSQRARELAHSNYGIEHMIEGHRDALQIAQNRTKSFRSESGGS